MSNRIVKQFVYGTFYLLVFALIGGSVYFAYVKPAPTCMDNIQNQREEEVDCGGPCVPCAIKKLQPIKILPVQLFEAGEGLTTAFVEFQNPNLQYGASYALATLTFYDEESKPIYTTSGDTFIYAGAVRSIVTPAIPAPLRAVARSELALTDIRWQSATEFPRPNLDLREIITRREGKNAVVEGVVQNKNAYGFNEVYVGALAVTKTGLFANASRTVLSDLQPFEERFFKIVIPILPAEFEAIDLGRTRVFVDARR
ncbi:MAG: hypothetical protein HYT82_01675 [Candidatus Harrisonbacteria bacterium]|nr:hypothetical protein [Candidatus Harrisonbacteria bacterium]